jgi:competence protein ComEC
MAAALLSRPPSVDGSAPTDVMRIVVLDVANENEVTPEGFVCEAILIVAPGGKTMLIDASWPSDFTHPNGREPSYGPNPTLPFLMDHGIDSLDWLVASHMHDDHFGGMPEIIRSGEVTVKELLWSTLSTQQLLDTEPWGSVSVELAQEIRDACSRYGVTATEARQGARLDMGGGVAGEILAVAEPEHDVPNYINNNGIVMRLTYRDFAMLFTGDTGFEQEERIMASGRDLSSDVLKIGHHAGAGSTSVSWMNAIDARVGVASMPRTLSLGNPNGERVYDQLKSTGMEIYRTWEHGDVEIQTDGIRYWVVPGR